MARTSGVEVKQSPAVRVVPAAGPVGAGLAAGLLAGLAMLSVATAYWWWLLQEAATPLRMIAVIAYGLQALIMNYGPLAAGFMIHMAMSAVFGLGFAFMTKPSMKARHALFAGLCYGAAIWAVMTFWVLPWVNPVMAERLALVRGPWLAAHLVFGAVVSIAPWLRRRTAAIVR